jgi:hypothetical protein
MKTLIMAVASSTRLYVSRTFRAQRLLNKGIAEMPTRRVTRYELFLMLIKFGILSRLKSGAHTRHLGSTSRDQPDVYSIFLKKLKAD